MCGITGYSGKGDAVILTRMNETLRQRGPDDGGVEVFPHTGRRWGTTGLGQRRLSILDLSPAGHQPMPNENRTVWVAFNGEIYNHQELREALTQPHTFRGVSDTEVIVHLYEECGEAVFEKLQGMFAIALYDTERDMLFLARDRMGKKPLYWSVQQDTLLFGSELKALLAYPGFARELDIAAVQKYFAYGYIPTPHAIFKNTWKLEPGTYLVWDGHEATKKQFWCPSFIPKATSLSASLDDLDHAVAASVRDRLVADVPVGVFLSGGLDSSTIAYYAARESKTRIKTFAIGFEERSFDESAYARRVAEHVGSEHFEETITAQASRELIPNLAEVLDEPIADASILPTYLLARFARQHITVALGGEGGDELFAGYDTFLAYRAADVYQYVPKHLRLLFRKCAEMLPVSQRYMSLDFRLKRFTAGFEGPQESLNHRWMAPYSESERQLLFCGEVTKETVQHEVYDDIYRYLDALDSHDRYDELACLFQRTYMLDQTLVKVDRASMAHALEVRSPLLDTRVVDLANHLPTAHKLHGTTRKYILKKLMEGRLPEDIIHRKKKGFATPIGAWLRGPLAPWMRDVLSVDNITSVGLFNYSYINQLQCEHIEGTTDNWMQLWTLIVFMLWWERWIKC